MLDLDRNLGIFAAWLGFCVVLLALSGTGMWVYGLAFFDTLKFFAGVFFLFYLPGSLLIRSVGLRFAYGLTYPVLALGTGTVVIPVFYKFLRYLNGPDYYALGLFGFCAISCLYLLIRRPGVQQNRLQLKLSDLLGVLALLMFILVLLHFSHFTDVLLRGAGFQFRSNDMSESVFHLGLINSLADTYPPPALYASGGTDFSSYHLNMHLQAELLLRLFGLDSLQLVSFYIPFFYFSLLVSLAYVFVRECGGTLLTGIICAALVFGSDFSFIPALLLEPRPGFAWTAFFQSTIWSLFTLNGILPSLIALYLCIIFLHDYFRCESWTKLFYFALLAYGAFGYKSPMGLQIGAAALATGLLIVFYGKQRRQGWSLALVSVVTLLVMLFEIIVLRSGVGDSVVAFAPLNGFHNALKNLGKSDLSVDWYLPMVMMVLLAGLGVRIVGLLFLGNRIRQGNIKNWSLVFIGLFFVFGYLISEMFFIGNPAGQNNSGWFYIQSLMAVWVLLFLFLVEIQNRKYVYLASILAVIVLAAPTTVQFLYLRADNNYVVFGQDELEMTEFLHQTDSDSVILHPLNLDRPSLASNFAGRATVLSVWVSFVTEAQGLSERVRDVMLFFEKGTEPIKRSKILEKYQVNYVYGPKSELFFMEELPEAELALQSGDLALYRMSGH